MYGTLRIAVMRGNSQGFTGSILCPKSTSKPVCSLFHWIIEININRLRRSDPALLLSIDQIIQLDFNCRQVLPDQVDIVLAGKLMLA